MAAYRFMVAPLYLSALIFICLLDKSACREATAPGPFALSIFIPPESSKTIRQWLKKGKQHSAYAPIEEELYFLQSIGLSARRIVVSGLNLLLFSNSNYLFRRVLHLLHLDIFSLSLCYIFVYHCNAAFRHQPRSMHDKFVQLYRPLPSHTLVLALFGLHHSIVAKRSIRNQIQAVQKI